MGDLPCVCFEPPVYSRDQNSVENSLCRWSCVACVVCRRTIILRIGRGARAINYLVFTLTSVYQAGCLYYDLRYC